MRTPLQSPAISHVKYQFFSFFRISITVGMKVKIQLLSISERLLGRNFLNASGFTFLVHCALNNAEYFWDKELPVRKLVILIKNTNTILYIIYNCISHIYIYMNTHTHRGYVHLWCAVKKIKGLSKHLNGEQMPRDMIKIGRKKNNEVYEHEVL